MPTIWWIVKPKGIREGNEFKITNEEGQFAANRDQSDLDTFADDPNRWRSIFACATH